MSKNDAYNFLDGPSAKWLEAKLLRNAKEISLYKLKPLTNVSWSKITVDGGRFIYSDGESTYYMFAYKARYATQYWQDLPRFHTEQCRTRIEYSDFQYANRMPVRIYCTDRNIDLGLQHLKFCRNCNRERNFFSFGEDNKSWDDVILGIAAEKSKRGYKETESRSDGYTMDWQQVSFAARAKKNFTCERCSTRLTDNASFYLEVHHRDYDRKNNRLENLEVLCVDCHSRVDSRHTRNYSFGMSAERLAAFRLRFRHPY